MQSKARVTIGTRRLPSIDKSLLLQGKKLTIHLMKEEKLNFLVLLINQALFFRL